MITDVDEHDLATFASSINQKYMEYCFFENLGCVFWLDLSLVVTFEGSRDRMAQERAFVWALHWTSNSALNRPNRDVVRYSQTEKRSSRGVSSLKTVSSASASTVVTIRASLSVFFPELELHDHSARTDVRKQSFFNRWRLLNLPQQKQKLEPPPIGHWRHPSISAESTRTRPPRSNASARALLAQMATTPAGAQPERPGFRNRHNINTQRQFNRRSPAGPSKEDARALPQLTCKCGAARDVFHGPVNPLSKRPATPPWDRRSAPESRRRGVLRALQSGGARVTFKCVQKRRKGEEGKRREERRNEKRAAAPHAQNRSGRAPRTRCVLHAKRAHHALLRACNDSSSIAPSEDRGYVHGICHWDGRLVGARAAAASSLGCTREGWGRGTLSFVGLKVERQTDMQLFICLLSIRAERGDRGGST
ncbi:hypothetical protein DFH11DRAFT_1541940 [Phellopilus nigrolimitatus]|nr:hypothetical protein DFH11DRAFT_1541940 [Phellopilus nigrolimitatus]